MTSTDHLECFICQAESVEPEAVVFRDDLWACEVLPGYEVPGWLFLRARRHALGWSGLDDQELSTFASRVRDVSAALKEVTGAPAVYLLFFGENYAHFHVLLTARGNDLPADRRGGEILKLRPEHLDRAESLGLVRGLSEAYGRQVG